jgi:histone deacetylase 1/2
MRDFLGVNNDGAGTEKQLAMAMAASQGGHGETTSYHVDPAWYADSGATHHLTAELEKLTTKESYQGHDQVHAANGIGMNIHNIGHALIPTSASRPLHLNHVLHVPQVTRNLLSMSKLTLDNPVFVELHPYDLFVKDRVTREILLRGRCRGGLYSIHVPIIKQALSAIRGSKDKWHCRLGHPALQVVQHILHKHELPFESSSNKSVCDACQQGKSHQLPFSLSTHVIKAPLELIHSDVWGPAKTSISGHKF